MTAQVAILNRNAVALATDSAVTTRNAQGVKVHNSANKLFTLSKYDPVGIMVHASAQFMGYPWETLIKVYRRWLGSKSFGSVQEYAESFFGFLLSQETLFPESLQSAWLKSEVSAILQIFRDTLNDRVRWHIDQHGSIDESTIATIFEALVGDGEKVLGPNPMLPPYLDTDSASRFADQASPIIDEAIDAVFQSLPIQTVKDRLRTLMIHRLTSDTALNYSGLVFAGFGDDEMLPVVETHWVDGVFGGLVRHAAKSDLSGNLNIETGSQILPFAQSDSVHRFLSGIDPSYKRRAFSEMDTLIDGMCDHVAQANKIAHPSDDSRSDADKAFRDATKTGKQKFHDELGRLEREQFISPVLDVIEGLPKDDLAAIAESLVNLTSFQRKIQRETETVGGPIDVAVISKGDGFIWIKRKHYFEKGFEPGLLRELLSR